MNRSLDSIWDLLFYYKPFIHDGQVYMDAMNPKSLIETGLGLMQHLCRIMHCGRRSHCKKNGL
jgi:hypothetical protein